MDSPAQQKKAKAAILGLIGITGLVVGIGALIYGFMNDHLVAKIVGVAFLLDGLILPAIAIKILKSKN